MNEHDMTEYAYKNGYEAGVEDLAKNLKEYFPSNADAIDYSVKEVLKKKR